MRKITKKGVSAARKFARVQRRWSLESLEGVGNNLRMEDVDHEHLTVFLMCDISRYTMMEIIPLNK